MAEERFCDRLNALIKKQRYKLRELASDAGISINTLGNLRANTVQPRQSSIDALARCLGVSSEWLRTGRQTTEAPVVDDLASLKGWFGGTVLQTVEAVIKAEVRRQVADQLRELLDEQDVALLRKRLRAALAEHVAPPVSPVTSRRPR